MSQKEQFFDYVKNEKGQIQEDFANEDKPSAKASGLLDKALDEWSKENKDKSKDKCPWLGKSNEFIARLREIEKGEVEDVQAKFKELGKLSEEIIRASKAARQKLADEITQTLKPTTKEEKALNDALADLPNNPFTGLFKVLGAGFKLLMSKLKGIWPWKEQVEQVAQAEESEATPANVDVPPISKENVEASGAGASVLKSAQELVSEKAVGKHCWDWVSKAFKKANARAVTLFKSFDKYSGKDCGDNCVPEKELIDPKSRLALKPGDWIYINNQGIDSKGNHSVIFLGWVDKENLIARTANQPGIKGPRIDTRDLRKTPVTYIGRPVSA